MQIVIDIPDWVIDKDEYTNYLGCMSEKLYEILQNGTPLDDIKAEINEAYQQSVTSNLYYAEGLERAFEIIDKHIADNETKPQ